MAVELEFETLVVRRDAARRVGLDDELMARIGTNGIERADDHLWATSAMGSPGVEQDADRLERRGLRIERDGRFVDGAIVDGLSGRAGLPCDWLAFDAGGALRQAWIRGRRRGPCAEVPFHAEHRRTSRRATPADRIALIDAELHDFRLDAVACAVSPRLVPLDDAGARLHQLAGDGLTAACAELAPGRVGGAVVTPGFDLPARHVVHVVVPRPSWRLGHAQDDAFRLELAWSLALEACESRGVRAAAFPILGLGDGGFTAHVAVRVAIAACFTWLRSRLLPEEVQLVAADKDLRIQLMVERERVVDARLR